MVAYIFILIGIAILSLWIWIVMDIVRSEFKAENDKLVYLLLALLVPAIGSIVYLVHGQHQKLIEERDELV